MHLICIFVVHSIHRTKIYAVHRYTYTSSHNQSRLLCIWVDWCMVPVIADYQMPLVNLVSLGGLLTYVNW